MIIRAAAKDDGATVDLTPVIDMVFLLLIFFLVATTFHQTEREMKIALPSASSSLPISRLMQEFVINVDQEGRTFAGGRSVESQTLRTMLREALAANPEQKVTVRGDRNCIYANVVTVLDLCKASGVAEPYLDTVLER
ncbi:MAG: biopolymer transporter ExbD [Planctomycetota bacterium]